AAKDVVVTITAEDLIIATEAHDGLAGRCSRQRVRTRRAGQIAARPGCRRLSRFFIDLTIIVIILVMAMIIIVTVMRVVGLIAVRRILGVLIPAWRGNFLTIFQLRKAFAASEGDGVVAIGEARRT